MQAGDARHVNGAGIDSVPWPGAAATTTSAAYAPRQALGAGARKAVHWRAHGREGAERIHGIAPGVAAMRTYMFETGHEPFGVQRKQAENLGQRA